MTIADPAAPLTPTVPVASTRRWALIGIFLLAGCWIATLAAMGVFSANPVVVNRAQVIAAEWVVEGDWLPGSPPQLQVTQIHKAFPGSKLTLGQTLELAPIWPQAIPEGKILVPLTAVRGRKPGELAYRVTQGWVPNLPAGPVHSSQREPLRDSPRNAEVQPLIYPANADTLSQLSQILQNLVSNPASDANLQSPDSTSAASAAHSAEP